MIMNRFVKKYDRLVFEEYKMTEEALAVFRMLFALFGLLIVGYGNVLWLSEVPAYFYQPQLLNIAPLLSDEIPSRWVLFLLSWLPALLLTAIFFGFYTRISSILFAVIIIVSTAFTASMGKIDHGIMYPLTALIMAFSGWERALSLDAQRGNTKSGSPHGMAPFLVALAIGFGMFTAGFAKWHSGWLDAERVGVLHHFFGSYVTWERRELLAPVFYGIRDLWFWKALDLATVIFEVGFLAAVIHKKAFQAFILLALVFHTLVLLMLNITIVSIFLAYALFLPWEKVLHYLRKKPNYKAVLKQLLNPRVFAIVILTIALLTGGFLLLGEKDGMVAVANIFLSFWEVDYRMIQSFIVYGLAWVFVVWHVQGSFGKKTWSGERGIH